MGIQKHRMDKDIPQGLIERYLDGTASREERLLLETSINRHLGREVDLPPAAELDKALPRNRAAVLAAIGATRPKPVRRLVAYASAAAAILIMAVATAWLLWGGQWPVVGGRQFAAADIAPGRNSATLTLADGRTIDLSTEQEGIIIQDGITYLDGSLVMENEALKMKNEGPGDENGILNSITTPKGGTYRITLPDGSKVWLNAASTLKYPSRFDSDERVVFLEGEAFFEIRPQVRNVETHDYASFKVQTAGQVVNVIGTEFNVSAYADDAETKTTLVTGKVRVVGPVEAHSHAPNKSSVILSPGEQSTTRGSAITVQEVDTESYTAWRDGYFKFQRVPITDIMQQLARWYDVDVRYDGPVKDMRYSGRIARTVNISAVLRLMELTDAVHFEIDANERRVTVKH